MALLEAPVILLKKIEGLRFLALAGAIGILVFIVSFVGFFVQSASSGDPSDQPAGDMRLLPRDWFKAAAAVPNIIGALAYQTNMFPIFKGMEKPGDSRMAAAIAVSLAFCTSSYLLVGILGYYYVGDTVGANFLNSLPTKNCPLSTTAPSNSPTYSRSFSPFRLCSSAAGTTSSLFPNCCSKTIAISHGRANGCLAAARTKAHPSTPIRTKGGRVLNR